MPSLMTHVDGLTLPNPFVIGSGPPGTNANVICRAFEQGWGAVIAKTVSLDSSKVVNVAPRYARLRDSQREVMGWENIELISDRSFDVWIDEFRRVKDKHPTGVLIASVMEECSKGAWQEVVGRCQDTGVDAFELNFSCPHGLPERRMGAAMGQDPAILSEVCGWVNEVARVPVWAKMTPNITAIAPAAQAALDAGCEGVAAINTILSVMSIDLATLRPEPSVEGFSVPGGYSCRAVRPIALRHVMEIATMMYGGNSGSPIPPELDAQPAPAGKGSPTERAGAIRPVAKFPVRGAYADRSISAIGGVETGDDAAQFILLGAQTVQVCTGVMIHGYELIQPLCAGLLAFMESHGFESIEDFRGHALSYFTTHAELVRRQGAIRTAERAAKSEMVTRDAHWDAEKFVEQSSRLVSND
ncbi:MAG: NAD-dependent dihydropyrimidine dehydrogenase subunit PreA [Planctomycetota bacterium]|jgi:dihydropyrimidine dehydrogenase (NADP+)/dihydropyrimidine dehydrogenase (NAD+) subunit PreA|nr:MAG: NAD-dependent dihydropyrimidine dehydrogenase subunit PreA [Planctomycetota bacterium]RLS93231.1 MAG: NAD-dependent dihydropyrimidine dehydrogenase subunit PreA [Planctomycetota bacterium]